MKKWMFLVGFGLAILPFLHRPIFVDDSSIFITAQAAARAPLHPYDYTLDLGLPNEPVWKNSEYPANTNPPLSGWIVGGVMRLFGDKEAVIHLTMWFFAVLALVGAKKITDELNVMCSLPGWLLAFSPVFFLTAQTLYPHMCYFAFYLVSIWIALRLSRRPSKVSAFALGAILALAALCLEHWPVLICI